MQYITKFSEIKYLSSVTKIFTKWKSSTHLHWFEWELCYFVSDNKYRKYDCSPPSVIMTYQNYRYSSSTPNFLYDVQKYKQSLLDSIGNYHSRITNLLNNMQSFLFFSLKLPKLSSLTWIHLYCILDMWTVRKCLYSWLWWRLPNVRTVSRASQHWEQCCMTQLLKERRLGGFTNELTRHHKSLKFPKCHQYQTVPHWAERHSGFEGRDPEVCS